MAAFRGTPRTADTYLAGLGVSGALTVGALAVFLIVIAVVSFGAWPQAAGLFAFEDGAASPANPLADPVKTASKAVIGTGAGAANAGPKHARNGQGDGIQGGNGAPGSTAPTGGGNSPSGGGGSTGAGSNGGQQGQNGGNTLGNSVQNTTNQVGNTVNNATGTNAGNIVSGLGNTVGQTLNGLGGGH